MMSSICKSPVLEYNENMSKQILQDDLYWSLLQVAIRAKHSLMRLGEKYELGIMQMYTLCSMAEGRPIPMNSFSSLLMCDASNVTGIIDRLFAQKLIMRQESPDDRRVKIITLTPKGEELKRKILAEIHDYGSSALGNLNPKQRRELQKIIALALQR